MKTKISAFTKRLWLACSASLIAVSLFWVFSAGAQGNVTTLTTLRNFGARNDPDDCARPVVGLVVGQDGNLYGTSPEGGDFLHGAIYSVTPGGAFTKIHSFDGVSASGGFYGGPPDNELVLGSDGYLYGSAQAAYAGTSSGVIFRLSPTGGYELIYLFPPDPNNGQPVDGAPIGALVEDTDHNFFGTTSTLGTIFKITPAGDLVTYYRFGNDPNSVNKPTGGLVRTRDGRYYGCAGRMVYRFVPAASSIEVIYTFPSDVPAPIGTLLEGNDGNLYGAANSDQFTGHTPANIFKLTPAGQLTTLYNFRGDTDGRLPNGLMQASDGNFYGVTSSGGEELGLYTDYGGGTVFQMTPEGVLTTLYAFSATDRVGNNLDGLTPKGRLVQARDGNLYGITENGGMPPGGGQGTGVFYRVNLSLPSPTPTPGPSATPTPGPSPSPTGTPGPSATPSPTASPSPTTGPIITNVTRQYPGVFLQGTPLNNRFDVGVNWNGQPGSVEFAINGSVVANETGGSAGALHIFDIGRDFTPSFSPISLRLIAQNGAGKRSEPNLQSICVVPFPAWLSATNASGSPFEFTIGSGDVKAKFGSDFPKPHLAKEGPIDIPMFVPFIGGKFGLTDTFARVEGEVSSNSGSGSVTLSGQTGFKAASQSLSGKVSGTGSVLLLCGSGLQLDSTTFKLNLTGTLTKEAGIADVIPQLIVLQRVPVIGRAITWFNKKATLTGEIEPSLDFSAVFKQDTGGNLKFNDTTGALAIKLKATLQANVTKGRLAASGWVAGGGSSTLGLPAAPFVRELKTTFEAGVEFKLDYIIKKDWKAETAYNCSWTPTTGAVCGKTETGASASNNANAFLSASEPFSVIPHDYAQFGPHGQLTSANGNTVVANVFAGAAPQLIALPSGAQLLIWVDADTSLPPTQATGIMWSMRDAGGDWSQPQLIAQDTRGEFSPVAAVDHNGKVVAGWLRVKEGDFPATVETDEDVARFYKDFEVVTADFDPAARAWSNVSALTDDAALDTDLTLSSDGTGALLLSWISNPNAELMSSAESPATLKYSFRNDTGWTAPSTLASSLVGVGSHAAAVNATEGFIILPRDPDADADNDGVLDVYRLNNGTWSGPVSFAAGGVENRLPAVAYDSAGAGRIVWQRGGDLVSATLDDPTPHLVRAGSTGLGFYSTQLVANAKGNLALLYEQPVADGAVNLFASTYYAVTKNWGTSRRLVEDVGQSRNPSAYFDATGALQIAFLTTDTLRTTRTVMIDGVQQVVENIPVDGQTDLKTAVVSEGAGDPSALRNIATRIRVETGDNVMIAGFIISGTEPKQVIVRAIGPDLTSNGVAGVLADPTLELHKPDGTIVSNDNWKENQQTVIEATGFAPHDDAESAIVATLPPGSYTAIVRGKDNGTGVSLVEVYDLDSASTSTLGNIATRGLVQTDDNVLIGGIIIGGEQTSTVLVRTKGPSLTAFGVSNALQDPELELHDSNGSVISNSSWRESQAAEITATDLAPSDDREAAILATFEPGNYTAIVRGKNNTTGVALVEAFKVK